MEKKSSINSWSTLYRQLIKVPSVLRFLFTFIKNQYAHTQTRAKTIWERLDGVQMNVNFEITAPFSPHRLAEWKRAAISKQTFIWTPSSLSYIILALGFCSKVQFSAVLLKNSFQEFWKSFISWPPLFYFKGTIHSFLNFHFFVWEKLFISLFLFEVIVKRLNRSDLFLNAWLKW